MTRHVTYECDLCHVVIEADDDEHEPPPDWEALTDGQHLCDNCVDKVTRISRQLT